MSEHCEAAKCRQEPSVKLYGVWLCERHDMIVSEMMEKGHSCLHTVMALVPDKLRKEIESDV